MVRKLGFWIVFSIYLLAFAADFTTTFMVGETKSVLESNPMYDLFGMGFTFILLLNGATIWMVWWMYSRPNSSPTTRFFYIMFMLLIIAVRIYAVHNAVGYIQNPVTMEQAIQIATPEAKLETTKQVAVIVYPPLILAIIGFLFWKLDHKIERR